ncbi:MAG: DUF1616 domain-containing protein [Methanosarcinaceae archaeon]
MFKSKKCLYTQDLKVPIIFAIFSVIFILVPPLNETPLRILFALPLLFFIPGYAFIAMMFPKKDEISLIERFTLSVGFSIAITVFDGFGLSLTQWLFRPNSISISLLLLTIIFSIIAYFARRRHPEDEQYTFSFREYIDDIRSEDVATGVNHTSVPKPKERTRFSIKKIPDYLFGSTASQKTSNPDRIPPEIEKALIIALVGSIIIASGMLIYAKMTMEEETFTALYILGPDGKAENYPTVALPGNPLTVTVGIENYEKRDVDYLLQMKLDGAVLQTINVSIPDEMDWQKDITYAPTQMRKGESKLEFALYKDEVSGNPYRTVHLWITHNYSVEYFQEMAESSEDLTIPDVGNGDMEQDHSWNFLSYTGNVNGSYVESAGTYGSRAFSFNSSSKGQLPQWNDQLHIITNTFRSDNNGNFVLSVFVKDTFTSEVATDKDTQFKKIFINNILIWEDGIGGNEDWQHVQVPVTLYQGDNTISLQLKQNGNSNMHPVQIYWDDIAILPLSELSSYLSDEGTIEFDIPSSQVLPLNEYVNTTNFTVRWSGTDEGSGIDYFIVDYSTDGANWTNWITATETTSRDFAGDIGKTYYFRSKAVDNAGNWESEHSTADTHTTIDTTSPTLTLDIRPNPSAGLTWLTVHSSKPLVRCTCMVIPKGSSSSRNVEMTSSDGITWSGEYDVDLPTNHIVEVIGTDSSFNTNTVVDTILVST